MKSCVIKKDEIFNSGGMVFFFRPLDLENGEKDEDFVKLFNNKNDERPFVMLHKSRIIEVPENVIEITSGHRYVALDYFTSIKNEWES